MDTITRDNYEEHFLLYAEGELSPEERLEVEAFLRLNPDLRAELEAYDPVFRLPDIALRYRPRPRPLVWLRPLSIAASVALVVGVGIKLMNKEGKLSCLPQAAEVAQVETPRSTGVSPVQGGRASSPDLAGKMPAIRGQAENLPSQPTSQTLEIVQIDDEATFLACLEAQIIQAASIINV